MSLYICTKCKNIENTALSRYWSGSRLCSKCDPEIGKWHGIFSEQKFDEIHDRIDKDGFVTKV